MFQIQTILLHFTDVERNKKKKQGCPEFKKNWGRGVTPVIGTRELRVLPDLGPDPDPYLDLISDPVYI